MSPADDPKTEELPPAPDRSATVVPDERLDRAAQSLPRRRFFNDMPDKGLFAFIAVFGFAIIVALKVYDYNADIVAIIAVALMMAYGLIAYRIPAVQLRLDRLGDNFYYLGFIFTLASMSAALLQLRRGADIEALLGSFGIALFTTIVGVAGRVLFVQMRSEIDEVEAVVRRDLLAASNDLRAQLSLALREFETFHTGVRQSSSELMSQSIATVQGQSDRIEAVARAAADRIKAAFEGNQSDAQRLSEVIVKIARGVEQLTQQLDQQSASFGRELEALLERLAKAIEAIAGRRRRRKWYWLFLK